MAIFFAQMFSFRNDKASWGYPITAIMQMSAIGKADMRNQLVSNGKSMTTILQDVLDTAERAVDAFSDRANGSLDFSEGSLSIVEEMLAEASGYTADMSQSEISSLVQLFGCYILEVARAAYGGDYAWIDEAKGPVLVVGEPDTHIAIATWSKVRGRLNGDSADNIPFFYQGFSGLAKTRTAGKRVLFV
jgi:hypothetical protein